MAVGIGFSQLFQGIGKVPFLKTLNGVTQSYLIQLSSGQVGGVAISSAIFQSNLESELRSRIINRPDSEEVRSHEHFSLFSLN